MGLHSRSVPVVSVRIGPEAAEFLKKRKLKPGPFAKEAVEKEVRRRQFHEAMDYVRKHPLKTRDGRSAADLIREDRDHGH